MQQFVYIQVVPLYLRSDAHIFAYFQKFKEEVDALTGRHLVVAVPDGVEAGDPQVFGRYFSEQGTRYPGLKRSDLPCLWIEDGNKNHAIVRIPNDPGDPSRMIKILADEAENAKSAGDLAQTLRKKHSDIFIETSPWFAELDRLVREATMSKSMEKLIAVCFGAVFIVAILAMAVFYPAPTAFQYTVFRIVLAIAAGGFASMIPGFLQVTVSNYVRAGGALAVFVIVYFFSPAALVANP
jgi:hypothetical protein